MKGCLRDLALILIHFSMSLLIGFNLAWYSGRPILFFLFLCPYWWFARIYWKMGSQYIANAAVVTSILTLTFGWIEWRQPSSIAVSRYARGDTAKAFQIIENSLPDDPESLQLHIARHQLALHTLDLDVVDEEVRHLSEMPLFKNVSKVLDCELQMLDDEAQASTAHLTKQIDATPQTWLYALRGCCHLSLNDLPRADEDFRKVDSDCQRTKMIWLGSPAYYVEVRYLAAFTQMQMSHVARRKADLAGARASIHAAVKEFESGQLVRSLGPPNTYLLIPREQFVGNMIYAWAEALARQAGDSAEVEALQKARDLRLKHSVRDLSGFVETHLKAGTAPSWREQLQGFCDAAER